MNNYTVVKQYHDTKAAEYVKGSCDTYWDYHLDKSNLKYHIEVTF